METMRQEGITDILTHDNHFTQEGFTILLYLPRMMRSTLPSLSTPTTTKLPGIGLTPDMDIPLLGVRPPMSFDRVGVWQPTGLSQMGNGRRNCFLFFGRRIFNLFLDGVEVSPR